LVHYLFLIIGEILNHVIKQEVRAGRIQGIKLPGALEDRIVAKVADDTSLSIWREEAPIQGKIQIFQALARPQG
jgi:hypothetical protein